MLLAGGWMGSQRRAKGLSGGGREVTSTTRPGASERGLCGGRERLCYSGGGDCPGRNRHATEDVFKSSSSVVRVLVEASKKKRWVK